MTSKQIAAAALDLLMKLTGMVDADVAAAAAQHGVRMSRQSVQTKRVGAAFQLDDIDTFMKIFNVPREVFHLEPSDLFAWVGANRPDWAREFAMTAGAGSRRRPRSRCDAATWQPPLPGLSGRIADIATERWHRSRAITSVEISAIRHGAGLDLRGSRAVLIPAPTRTL